MAGGGFLAGFTSGIGEGARQLNQNYMDMQLAKYKNAGKLWETLANDQSYHPNIRQQFAQKALSLNSVNLFDKNSRATADAVLKENPHESVQQAIDAMRMTGTQMPSYYGASGTVDPIEFDKQKKSAELQAQYDFMVKQSKLLQDQFGGQGPGSDLENLRNQEEMKKRVFGAAIPTFSERTEPYANWTAADGSTGIGATYAHGRWFDTAGREVKVSGFAPPQMVASQNPDGSMSWVGVPKQVGPTGVAAPPRILGSQTVAQADPSQLTTVTQTQRSLTPIAGQGGHPQGAIPGTPPVAPPMGGAAAVGATPGVVVPPPALQRASFGAGPVSIEDAAWTGLKQSHRIVGLVQQYPLVGPILGRAVEMGNKIGSAKIISFANKMLGNKDPNSAVDDAIEQAVPKAAQLEGADEATAQAAAEIITAMRAMNTAEVAMLSQGGGRGITRMFEMLQPALMNPHQDMSILRGHMKSVDMLFADKLRSIYTGRHGNAKPPLQPDQTQVANELGILDRIYGSNIPPLAQDKYTAGTAARAARSYKMYRKNPTTGQRWGSDDGQNWFDAKTGQPYQEPPPAPK